MTKKNSGFYWHIHHDELVEYCWDYEERVRFIKENKPADEREARLTLFQPIKGKLPQKLVKALETAHKDAHCEAWDAYCPWCRKARDAYCKVLEDNKQFLEDLHRKECPNCIWDGEELDFTKWPKKKRKR